MLNWRTYTSDCVGVPTHAADCDGVKYRIHDWGKFRGITLAYRGSGDTKYRFFSDVEDAKNKAEQIAEEIRKLRG